MWFYVACFGDRISVTFHPMFAHYTFSSVWVAEWPPFGKALPIGLAVCSDCILSFCDFICFPFGLRAGAPVPVHCLLVTFSNCRACQ